jgi:hypothetical protein
MNRARGAHQLANTNDVIAYLEDLDTKSTCQLWAELDIARLCWWVQPSCPIPGCLVCGDYDPATQYCTCDYEVPS